MSDSDDNLTQQNMFENENTILRGRSSFFNQRFKNLASSTQTSMLQNFNSGHSFNHRSMLPVNRRETSPMSLRSVPDYGHNYENSYYSRSRACESVINGRSQSPGSVGSMDSTTSAVFVAQIFKNMKFNKYDKRIIHEAYNKYFRNRERRRVGKRRKLKLFIKHNRRKSDDSGDDGSNSSMSSEDNRSVRSALHKESILRPSKRSNRAEILNFRDTMKKSDIYRDCTENIRNSSLKNIFNDNHVTPTLQSTNILRETGKDYIAINAIPQKDNNYKSNIGIQRERFTKGFTLPVERFNKSVIKPIANRNMLPTNFQKNPQTYSISDDSNSENDDIFPNQTVLSVNNTVSRKRTLENNDSTVLSIGKRNKLSSDIPSTNPDDITFKKPQMPVRRPIKSKPNFLSGAIPSKSKYPLLGFLSHSMTKDREYILNSTNNPNETIIESNPIQKCLETNKRQIDSDSDDIFTPNILRNTNKQQSDEKDKNDNEISPQNIVKKRGRPPNSNKKKNQKDLPDKSPQAKKKTATEEILISKSVQPLTGNVEIMNAAANNKSNGENSVSNENISDNPLSISEMSMKPSFIKRKLFTQKLDIADDKNDSLVANSPHPKTYKLREKNKVRKLATSQSCLSRDIAGGENILDLIHKIVPANQMNITAATNQKARISQDNDDKWDVTSVISMCNRTNESDTFTDEDIFHISDATKVSNKNQKNQPSKKINEKHNIILEKMNMQMNNKQEQAKEIHFKSNDITTNRTNKRTVSRCVNAYWDTDFETDLEDNMRLPKRTPAKATSNTFKSHLKEKVAGNRETIEKNNVCGLKPSDLKNKISLVSDCNVVLLRQEHRIKDDDKETKTKEWKGEMAKNEFSPKNGKTKEIMNADKQSKDIKMTKMPEKKNESVKKRVSPKTEKNVDINNAKINKEKVTKLPGKKVESAKKVSSPKNNNKENGTGNKSKKDLQKPVTEKVKNDNRKQSSSRTLRTNVKNITKKCDTKLKSSEPKIQAKKSAEVLQENKIISTIKTRKQKSFLNDSLNSSCERSIFTRSFTLQNKQRLL